MEPAASPSPARSPVPKVDGAGDRHALVLSGGGARGAYEIGVMKALFEGTASTCRNGPLAVRIFTGTSVGAYNAAFLAQEENPGADSLQRLEALWRERIANTLEKCGNGVYRLRADPLRLLDPGCLSNPLQLLTGFGRDVLFWSGAAAAYGTQLLTSDAPYRVRLVESFNLTLLFSLDPLDSLLRETIDLSRLSAAPNALDVAVTDWRNGTAKVFRKADVIRLGVDAIKASTAFPGIFPPVPLEGTVYVDGALRSNTPIKPAIREGANVLHVIFVDPETNEIPLPWQEGALPSTADALYRFYTIIISAQLNHDMRHAATINEEIAARGAVAAGGELPAVRASRARRMRRGTAPPSSAAKVYQPITIHSYRPLTDLMGAEAFLDFSSSNVNMFIDQGYKDAVNHDCLLQGCVLSPGVPVVSPARRLAEVEA